MRAGRVEGKKVGGKKAPYDRWHYTCAEMSPIPQSSLPGHKRLHERAVLALNRCQELQAIDFKESCAWQGLQWRIIKTLLAMANLRDGGILIVGVSERGDDWELTGITTQHLETFDVDTIVGVTNSFASPFIELDIVTVQHNDTKFLVIQAAEFSDSPIVCKKNGPPEKGLFEGAVYVRPPGLARTTRITSAAEMHDLLELAAEKRARRILEQSRRVGIVPAAPSTEQFDEELAGL